MPEKIMGAGRKKILIGMGGWEIQSFNSALYPAKPGKGFRKLEYYSRFFDLVEVNATFYNTAFSPAQAGQWLKDVENNKEFTFTLKLFRGFTHAFNATKDDALAIHRLLEPLRSSDKLAGLVVQFSSSFARSDSRQNYLVKLRSIFPEDTLFLDLRHISWNDAEVADFCREYGYNLINVDLPQLPDHVPFNSFSQDNKTYFRMMGRNRSSWNNPGSSDRYLYNYNETELDDLIQRIKRINAEKTYVVFHNDRQPFSLVNGRQVEHVLNPEKRLTAPVKLLSSFPQLKSFCDPQEPGDKLLLL